MRTWLSGLVLAAAAAAGCGSGGDKSLGPSYGSEDGRQISMLVSLVNDDKSTAGTLKRHFAAGAAADYRKFPAYAFEVKGNPVIAGDTATATVALRTEIGDKDAGEKEWAFVKAGGEWKVKAAPLP